MTPDKIYHYSVALSLNATWKENMFTYSHTKSIPNGSLVSVPFGKEIKYGYIVKKTHKPSFKIKPINTPLDKLILPREVMLLMSQLNEIYPNAPGVHVQHFIPSFLWKTKSFPKEKTHIIDRGRANNLPELTSLQQKTIQSLLSQGKPNILHGITGSGKTRIYTEMARETLQNNRNVLIIYPEISLTAQLNESLRKSFDKDTIDIFHSKLSQSVQKNTWLSVKASKGRHITIGPRSALYLPHSNLGLVIVDEAQDASYKENNGTHYNGVSVAGFLANVNKAKLVLGSATPPVKETYQVLAKGGSIVCLHDLAIKNATKRDFITVDMTKKSNFYAGSQLLSKQLVRRVKSSLNSEKQSLLFLNRRGTSRMLLCENCGWHAKCSRCDMPVSYHHDTYSLNCHVCGLRQKVPSSCPDCNHTLSQKSPGVKAIEVELQRIFPTARVARFDSDNRKRDSFTEQYQNIRDGVSDIILGTQLLTKGLDLPLLETVGILQADSALYLPDFSSEERLFQQLTQVSGRVGRGHSDGTVIIQTYQPSQKIFDDVRNQDWHKFYENELVIRKRNCYPPYSFAMKIWVLKSSQTTAEKTLKRFKTSITDRYKGRILGPAPSFYRKTGGKYSWQIIFLSPSRKQLVEIAKNLPKDVYYDLDPVSLL